LFDPAGCGAAPRRRCDPVVAMIAARLIVPASKLAATKAIDPGRQISNTANSHGWTGR
jgi:hypothetical protein